jgi:hypothetical protein
MLYETPVDAFRPVSARIMAWISSVMAVADLRSSSSLVTSMETTVMIDVAMARRIT